MPHDRYYHPELTSPLTGDEHRHLFKVMRAHEGSTFELIDGKGTLATAQITSIDKKAAHFTITSKTHQDPPPQKTLIQSLIKQPKLELVVEKCTELGITDFIFFPAERSDRTHLSDNNIQRLRQISIAATKQSGRLYLPTFTIHTQMVIPENAAYASLKGSPGSLSPIILIGPESGWSPAEESLLASKSTPILLSYNTLRAETAAIVAATHLTHPQ